MSLVRTQIGKLSAEDRINFFRNTRNSLYLDEAKPGDEIDMISRISNFPQLVYKSKLYSYLHDEGKKEFFKKALTNADVAVLLDKEEILHLYKNKESDSLKKFSELIGIKSSLVKYFPDLFTKPLCRIKALVSNPTMRQYIPFDRLKDEERYHEIREAIRATSMSRNSEKQIAFLFSFLKEDEKIEVIPELIGRFPYLFKYIRNQNESLIRNLSKDLSEAYKKMYENGMPVRKFPSLLRFLHIENRTSEAVRILKEDLYSLEANFKFFTEKELDQSDYKRVFEFNPFLIRDLPKNRQTPEICETVIMAEPFLIKECEFLTPMSELFITVNHPEYNKIVKEIKQKMKKRKP